MEGHRHPNGTKAVHTYNSRNWLTCISNRKADDTVIAEFTYTYDPTYWGKNGTRTRVVENILKPDGNRISAQVDYEYDDLYRLVHEHRIAYGGGDPGVAYEYNFAYDGAGNRTAWQVVGGDGTISRLTSSTARYYFGDGLASVKGMTDGSESVTDAYAYDAWGNSLAHLGSTDQPYQYVGRLGYYAHVQESSVDLLQLGARYYDPGVGRFTSKDPIGYSGGLNLYSYVSDQPTGDVDPKGLYTGSGAEVFPTIPDSHPTISPAPSDPHPTIGPIPAGCDPWCPKNPVKEYYKCISYCGWTKLSGADLVLDFIAWPAEVPKCTLPYLLKCRPRWPIGTPGPLTCKAAKHAFFFYGPVYGYTTCVYDCMKKWGPAMDEYF